MGELWTGITWFVGAVDTALAHPAGPLKSQLSPIVSSVRFSLFADVHVLLSCLSSSTFEGPNIKTLFVQSFQVEARAFRLWRKPTLSLSWLTHKFSLCTWYKEGRKINYTLLMFPTQITGDTIWFVYVLKSWCTFQVCLQTTRWCRIYPPSYRMTFNIHYTFL